MYIWQLLVAFPIVAVTHMVSLMSSQFLRVHHTIAQYHFVHGCEDFLCSIHIYYNADDNIQLINTPHIQFHTDPHTT